MHEIEPFYEWQIYYEATKDSQSPFYQIEYNEIVFSNTVYNYLVHPQWDNFGSETLYLKILFCDYANQFCVIELIGEWNDALYNDIQILKRKIIDYLIQVGIRKFVLICENVLNFYYSDDEYYSEWKEDIEESKGWIILLNPNNWVIDEMQTIQLQSYVNFLKLANWRTFHPNTLEKYFQKIV